VPAAASPGLRARPRRGAHFVATERDTTVWVRRVLPHLPVTVLMVAYTLRFATLSVAVHDGYGTPPYDMALFDQGIWLLSRFHNPFVTVMGRNLFGDHTCFILLLVVPLFWIYPHAQGLLVLQACVLAAAGIPLYLLGRRLLRSSVLATALVGVYLLNPALQNGNLEQFHPESLMVLALATALYAAVDWRPRLFAVAAAAVLLCKQDTALLVVPLGLWVAWRRDRRWGLAVAAAAVAWMAIAFYVVIDAFLGTTSFNSVRIPFGGFTGTIRTILGHPATFWHYLRSQGRGFYLWQMGSSVGWGFLIAPEVAAIAVLTFAENELADFIYMHQIIYHYSMPLVPVLVAGTIVAIGRLATARRRQVATGVVTASAVIACALWGLAPFSRQTYPHLSTSDPEVVAIDTVLRALPPNAVVSAYYPYVSHIDHRTRIYMWPTPFAASYWGLYHQEGQRLPFADQIQYLVLPTDLIGSDASTFAGIATQYRVVTEDDGVALYQKVAGAPPGPVVSQVAPPG